MASVSASTAGGDVSVGAIPVAAPVAEPVATCKLIPCADLVANDLTHLLKPATPSNPSYQSAAEMSLTGINIDPPTPRVQTTECDGSLSECTRGLKPTTLVWLCCICVSMTSMLLGYDVGIMSGALYFINADLHLSPVQEEVLVGTLNMVAALGGLVAGPMADSLGRRKSIKVASLAFILGGATSCLATSFRTLLLGRVIIGVAVGWSFVISPMYNAEIAPPEIRGKLVALSDVFINIGLVLGYVLAFVFDNNITGAWKWRVMLGMGVVPPFLILLTLLFLPESPRWLMTQKKEAEALRVLNRLTPSKKEAKKVFHNIKQANQDATKATWGQVLWNRRRAVRKTVFIVLGLCFAQQASGSEVVVYYTPTVLHSAGFESKDMLFLGAIIVGLCKLIGEVVALCLVETIGRTAMLNMSAMLASVSMCFLTCSLSFEWSPYWNLLGLCMFMWWFSFGIGPITWVVASELLPSPLRAKALSIGVLLNRATSGLCASGFLTMASALTVSGALLFYTAMSTLAILFYCTFIPETNGKSLEEIQKGLIDESEKEQEDGEAFTARLIPQSKIREDVLAAPAIDLL
eukprot:CAMPEP_0113942666 /NCGR_PEP_ID=MMETSP1339-20121228/8323_1 /TAXON_ID=94617 /ORGANISM="Fibrocapsa japonica" /LENGTH=576 /DNA_ID=CAMNT_0000947203 /DNA_START=212 /DNA_END=1942 /DNA_ORIENTATION=- /assembly_acc=CAM_ASM_000762